MSKQSSHRQWPRIIALVDMNCFFAQIEQHDFPHLYKKPVAVTNGKLGSTIITSSYEARRFGIKTGMKLKDARQLCPHLIQAPSRPNRYAAISTAIMESLTTITPIVEVYSVDEAFLDLTGCQSVHGSPEQMGQLIKDTIFAVSGLTCSVGISGDKTTAKFAAKKKKPDGLVIIPPWQAEQRLSQEVVTELSGINKGTAHFLARYGIYKCGDMKKVPMSLIAQRFGNMGRRIWLMAQGKDPEPVITTVKAPQSVGHGKVTPPGTKDMATILTFFQHMSERVAARLRQYHYFSDTFFIGLKTRQGWLSTKATMDATTNDGALIYELCKRFISTHYAGEECRQVQVTALTPTLHKQQDLFISEDSKQKRAALNQAIDQINHRYGEFTIAPTRVIGRSEMPNVIAPAWKPSGLRKSI